MKTWALDYYLRGTPGARLRWQLRRGALQGKTEIQQSEGTRPTVEGNQRLRLDDGQRGVWQARMGQCPGLSPIVPDCPGVLLFSFFRGCPTLRRVWVSGQHLGRGVEAARNHPQSPATTRGNFIFLRCHTCPCGLPPWCLHTGVSTRGTMGKRHGHYIMGSHCPPFLLRSRKSPACGTDRLLRSYGPACGTLQERTKFQQSEGGRQETGRRLLLTRLKTGIVPVVAVEFTFAFGRCCLNNRVSVKVN
ncbi:MAG: hypothetical protein JWR26_3178 [Pedosphaera sp.]|nr:hypothetical protein [Pedosphaera sp.]